jgi:hypothetical protein
MIKALRGILGESVGRAVDVAGFLQNRDMFNLLWKKGLRSVSTTASFTHIEH